MITITVDDQALVEDLDWHFWRSGFVVERIGHHTVAVVRPDAGSRDQEWRESALHLAVWQALNPNVVVKTWTPRRSRRRAAQPQL